jgi:putative membrane protein
MRRDHSEPSRYGHGFPGLAAPASAMAVLVATVPLVLGHELGPLSRHMLIHILTMNVAAPGLAAMLVATTRTREVAPGRLWLIAAAQVLLLWLLHTPRFHLMAAHSAATGLTMHVALAGLAVTFWFAVLSLPRTQRWHAPAILLLTGKLACLLAAILIFSPRLLYSGDHGTHAGFDLADRHLAGLLMIVACPLSYVTAAILITVRLIHPQAGGQAALAEREYHAP